MGVEMARGMAWPWARGKQWPWTGGREGATGGARCGAGAVAVFVQAASGGDAWGDMVQCARHVASAGALASPCVAVDLYVSIPEGYGAPSRESAAAMASEVAGIREARRVVVSRPDNIGADVGQFLAQLVETQKERYDLLLKVHTKSNLMWRGKVMESLCGSPEQVLSIWNAMPWQRAPRSVEADMMETSGASVMVAAQGTFMDARADQSRSWLTLAINSEDERARRRASVEAEKGKVQAHPPGVSGEARTFLVPGQANFNAAMLENLARVGALVLGRAVPPDEAHTLGQPVIVAGTQFWAQYSPYFRDTLPSALPVLRPMLAHGYVSGAGDGVEHVLERLIPTMVQREGGVIGEIQPAPRIMLPFNRVFFDDDATRLNDHVRHGVIFRIPIGHPGTKDDRRQRAALDALLLRNSVPPFAVAPKFTGSIPDPSDLGNALSRYLSHPSHIRDWKGRPLVLGSHSFTISFREPSSKDVTSDATWMDCDGLRVQRAKYGLFAGIPFVRGCQRPVMPEGALTSGASWGARKLHEALVTAFDASAKARRRVEVSNYIVLDAWDDDGDTPERESFSALFLGVIRAALERVPIQIPVDA